MPIDKMMLDPMLSTFRNMVEDCRSKNLSGENFDKMCETFARMEQLGQEHSDFNAFNAQLMQENLFGVFSDYYGRTLSESAKASVDEKGYDDATLLTLCLDGLRQSVDALQQGYEDAIAHSASKGERSNAVEVEVLQNPEALIGPIKDLIALGEQQGMTLPDFLRIQIEKGLDKAAEGTIASKNGLLLEQEFAMVNPITPYELEETAEKIETFEQLCSKSPFGVPDWKIWSFLRNDIERKREKDILVFKRITSMWETIIDDLAHWSLSYTSFAPFIEPWRMSANPREAVVKTQNTYPGIIKEKEKLLLKYYGISFMEIFKHPTFLWTVKYNYFDLSQEFVTFLIEKVYPACKPFQHLSAEIIEERGTFHPKGPTKQEREQNPEITMAAERMRDFYDKKFQPGLYDKKYGPIVKSLSIAKPWNLNSFTY